MIKKYRGTSTSIHSPASSTQFDDPLRFNLDYAIKSQTE